MARPGFLLVAPSNVKAARLLPHGELQIELKEPIGEFSKVTLQAGVLSAAELAPAGEGHDAEGHVVGAPIKAALS
jgi:hypothetical protein